MLLCQALHWTSACNQRCGLFDLAHARMPFLNNSNGITAIIFQEPDMLRVSSPNPPTERKGGACQERDTRGESVLQSLAGLCRFSLGLVQSVFQFGWVWRGGGGFWAQKRSGLLNYETLGEQKEKCFKLERWKRESSYFFRFEDGKERTNFYNDSCFELFEFLPIHLKPPWLRLVFYSEISS